MPPSCTGLTGRRLDICRGHDDAGRPIDLAEWKRQAYLVRWGLVPGQPETRLARKQSLAEAAKQVALYESLRPMAERLAEETGEPRIVANALRYRVALKQWKKAGFPVRDPAEREVITETICPGCCRYRDGACGRCGGKGQLIVALAWMGTAQCPGGVWELW